MCENKQAWTDRALLNILSQEQLYNILLKKYAWAQKYIYYYLYIAYAVRDNIEPILDSIQECDRCNYSSRKAYQYLKKYTNKIKFATIIPTCNRPEAVKYLLNYVAASYRRLGVDIIIYDSSDNNQTKNVVQTIQSSGYYNVIYKKYLGVFDGFSLDHKIIDAYKEFANQYDYLWLCRDGLVPVIDEIIEKINYYAAQHVECFIVDTKSRTNFLEIEKEYSTLEDCNDFLLEQSSRLQTLGMLILSSKLALKMIQCVPLSDATYSLWQMAAPFHLFAQAPYKIVFFSRNVFAMNPDASTTHFWGKAKKALEQWARRWYLVITNMPQVYNNAKEKCLMVYTVDFHPFTYKTVLDMRGWGHLNLKLVTQYKEYLIKTTKTHYNYFLMVSLIPPCISRWISRRVEKHPNLAHQLRESFL